MKKIYFTELILLLLSISLHGMGINREPEFNIGEFHSVQVDIPCTITLIRGDDFLMDIEDRKGRIKELEIYNDRGTLVFKLKEWNLLRWLRKEDLGITLTMPEFNEIKISSSADISSDDNWENKEIHLRSSASGNIDLKNIKAEHAEIKTTASGDIRLGEMILKGALDLSVSGSGNIGIDTVSGASVKINNRASGDIDLGDVNVSAGQFQLKSSGSGECSFETVLARNIQLIAQSSGTISGIFISDSLEVKLSGSGDAKLAGRTGIASLKTSASGTVEASRMTIGEASVSGSGSGDIYLQRGTLVREVNFSGSGKLITR